MLVIDGSMGEGGGQVLRTSLSLAILTGRGIRLERIRAGRPRPGLMRQHLTAVEAARAICGARVEGATPGATELTFVPGPIEPGRYAFSIGTAGSTTLVLQTVLPALALASAPSELTLEGGTHNPKAPPWEFLVESYLPLWARLGVRVEAHLERPGFFPAGGGQATVVVHPCARLNGLDLEATDEPGQASARVLTANLASHIARREREAVLEATGWEPEQVRIEVLTNVVGPGNAVVLRLERGGLVSVFTGFGERGVSAEAVARQAVKAYRRFASASVAVDEHLADQLLLPLALAGRGSFTTLPLSLHARTQLELLPRFLDVPLRTEADAHRVHVEIG
jgi:RNA 3'-terminal phosphate cyclase (ATP)